VGPNGAGKTTAIKCLLGLLRYDGQITVDGLDAHQAGQGGASSAGYVPQELAFYDDLGALDTALFYARIKKVPARRAAEVLAEVGLAEQAGKRVGALSGGMKQRLALAWPCWPIHRSWCWTSLPPTWTLRPRTIPSPAEGRQSRRKDGHLYLAPVGRDRSPGRSGPGHAARQIGPNLLGRRPAAASRPCALK